MADGVEDEKLPTGSVTASWVQLDPNNDKPSGTKESPQYSDNDSYEENMTDALADASRSLYNSTLGSDDKEEQNLVKTTESSATPQKSEWGGSNLFYISAFLLSHSVAFVFGVLIGRKSLSLKR